MDIVTKTKSVTNTKLAVATLAALAAAGLAFVVTPFFTGNPKDTYDSYCIIHGGSAALPNYSAPDSDVNYIKMSIGKTKNLTEAKSKCTSSQYNALISNYCSSSSTLPFKDLKLSVAGFISSGTSTENLAFYGCSAQGCVYGACKPTNVPQPGLLSVVQDVTVPDSQVSAGLNNIKIGQYIIYSSATEDVVIPKVGIAVMNPANIENFYLMIEDKNIQAANTFTTVQGVNVFSTNYQLIIGKGQKATIGLYANIKSSASGYFRTYVYKNSLQAYGFASKAAYPTFPEKGPVYGPKMTIVPNTLSNTPYYFGCLARWTSASSSWPAFAPHEEITTDYYKINGDKVTTTESNVETECSFIWKTLHLGYCKNVDDKATGGSGKPFKNYSLLYNQPSDTKPAKILEYQSNNPPIKCE